MFSFKSIRTKFILFILLLLFTSAGIFVSIVIDVNQQSFLKVKETNEALMRNALEKEWEKKVRELTTMLAKEFIQPMYDLDIFEMQYLANLVMEGKGFHYVYIQDNQGMVLVDTTEDSILIGKILSDPLTKRILAAEDLIIQSQTNIVDVAAPILLGLKKLGTVRIGYSTEEIQEITTKTVKQVNGDIDSAIDTIIRNTLFVAGVAVMIAIGIALFLVRGLVLPIQKLLLGTQKIAKGDLTHRIKTDSQDEIGQLTVSFNEMTEALQKTTISKDFFDSIIQSMIHPMIVLNPDAIIRTLNPATLNLLGYAEQELLGQPIGGLIIEKEEVQKLFQGADSEALLKQGLIHGIEMIYRAKDSRKIPMLFSSSIMRNNEGSIYGIVCVAEDITERKQMEAALRQSNEDLHTANEDLKQTQAQLIQSAKLASLGKMAAGIAHELRQPLVGVRGLAEHVLIGIERNWKMPQEKLREKLQLIIEQADRVNHVIEHVRMFAREVGKSETEQVDVNHVVHSSINMVGTQLKAHGLHLEYKLTDNLPLVQANPFSLEEVILNLINNARDTVEERLQTDPSSSASIFLYTMLGGEEAFPHVQIQVIDRGVGISHENLPNIFDPFFTTKAPDKGLGLGLSICKSIIEEYGGGVQVQSVWGEGTTVTISLPAKHREWS